METTASITHFATTQAMRFFAHLALRLGSIAAMHSTPISYESVIYKPQVYELALRLSSASVVLVARIRGTGISARRKRLREELFPDDIPWLPSEEKGFFAAPRTLRLILALLKSPALRSNEHLGTVYLDLFARNMGEGIIQMSDEADHAYAAGYWGSRAIRTWRERMSALEGLALIQSKPRGNRRFGFVLLVHPTVAVLRLRARGVVPDEWWTAFRSRQQEIGDTSLERFGNAPGPDPAHLPTGEGGAA